MTAKTRDGDDRRVDAELASIISQISTMGRGVAKRVPAHYPGPPREVVRFAPRNKGATV